MPMRLDFPELRLDSIPGYRFNNQYNQCHGSIPIEHNYKLMLCITHVNTTRFTTRDFITADNYQPSVCMRVQNGNLDDLYLFKYLALY